jgi:hypothetical protein
MNDQPNDVKDTAETQRTQRSAEKSDLWVWLSPLPSLFAVLCGPLRPLRLCGVLSAFSILAIGAALAEDALPPGVAARVHGRDVREADVLARLAKRWGSTEKGKAVLEQLVDDTCVAAEAKKRGVAATDEEVRAYIRKVDDTIRKQTGGSRTIEDIYREEHTTPAEFEVVAREYLVRQKMAAEELGAKPGEEVSEARLKLWLAALRRRMNVRWTGLPDGVLAMVGEQPVDRTAFARALRARLPEDKWYAALSDLVLDAAAEHALAQAKIEITDADVVADLAAQRERFAKDPRVAGTGLTFDEYLRQSEGTSEAELRTDPRYRRSVGLLRLLSRRVADDDVKKAWEAERDRWGEQALVREIYVAAQASGGKFEGRGFEEAKELALRAKVAVLEASGQIQSPRAGKMALGDAVTAVAKQFAEDDKSRHQAGEPKAWTRVNLAGHDALEKTVFSCDLGTLQGPLRGPVGWHLFVVEQRRPAPSYDDVKDLVREDLLRKELVRFKLEMKSDPGVVLPR